MKEGGVNRCGGVGSRGGRDSVRCRCRRGGVPEGFVERLSERVGDRSNGRRHEVVEVGVAVHARLGDDGDVVRVEVGEMSGAPSVQVGLRGVLGGVGLVSSWS